MAMVNLAAGITTKEREATKTSRKPHSHGHSNCNHGHDERRLGFF